MANFYDPQFSRFLMHSTRFWLLYIYELLSWFLKGSNEAYCLASQIITSRRAGSVYILFVFFLSFFFSATKFCFSIYTQYIVQNLSQINIWRMIKGRQFLKYRLHLFQPNTRHFFPKSGLWDSGFLSLSLYAFCSSLCKYQFPPLSKLD